MGLGLDMNVEPHSLLTAVTVTATAAVTAVAQEESAKDVPPVARRELNPLLLLIMKIMMLMLVVFVLVLVCSCCL